MLRLIGHYATWGAFALAIYGLVAGIIGARRRDAALSASARSASYTNFALMTVANLVMIAGLVTHDFSIGYVAQVGSRSTPLFFTIISLWSALEGSILFWGWVLAGYTAAALYFTRDRLGPLGAYANAVLLGIGAFFYLLLVAPANPWQLVSPVPLDGPGPNPLLQNHPLMGVHPPLLYLGYVGLSVPFAFAMGALMSGKLDDTWVRASRRWTVVSWMFLTLAIIAGMWWSYEVLGWGGYWAWDPVENASFMPWLTTTAFLHSVMVEERRGMLRLWNLTLVITTFLLTILGTFLTRSGVLSSVHAFTEGTIGLYFLSFMAVVLLFSFALLAGRTTELRSEGRLDSALSRETVFLFNNLLLSAFTFTVLLGTLFPLVAEAVRGVKVSVGTPFFNRMTVPICVGLLFLVGVGPMLPWRVARIDELKRTLLIPSLALLLTLGGTLLLGLRDVYALLAFGFAAFALVANVQEYTRGTAARRRATGHSWPRALTGLVNSNPRRYGGYLAHVGLIVLAVGITASSTFRAERQVTLTPGQSVELSGYTVRFDRVRAFEEPQRFVTGAELTVFRGSEQVGTLFPRLNFYNMRAEPVATPDVRTRFTNDLYTTLLAFERDGSNATLSVIVEPLVGWIWFGGFVMAVGALVGAWPRRRALVRAAGSSEPAAAVT